jgi:hypothetical protein
VIFRPTQGDHKKGNKEKGANNFSHFILLVLRRAADDFFQVFQIFFKRLLAFFGHLAQSLWLFFHELFLDFDVFLFFQNAQMRAKISICQFEPFL